MIVPVDFEHDAHDRNLSKLNQLFSGPEFTFSRISWKFAPHLVILAYPANKQTNRFKHYAYQAVAEPRGYLY